MKTTILHHKKMRWFLISICVIAVIVLGAFLINRSFFKPSLDITYRYNHDLNGAILMKYKGPDMDVIIPSEIGNYLVVGIDGWNAKGVVSSQARSVIMGVLKKEEADLSKWYNVKEKGVEEKNEYRTNRNGKH